MGRAGNGTPLFISISQTYHYTLTTNHAKGIIIKDTYTSYTTYTTYTICVYYTTCV